MGSLVKLYGKHFRQQLSYHPVWQPGAEVSVGDFGRLHDGVFVREGRTDRPFKISSQALLETQGGMPMKFSTGVKLSIDAEVKAKATPEAKIEASLAFAREGGVVFHARDLTQNGIENVRAVVDTLPWREWGEGAVFVSELYTARSLGLVLAEGGDASMNLSGRANALGRLDLADASVAFGLSSSATYSMRLQESERAYPVAMRLYHAKRGILDRTPRPTYLEVADKPPPEAALAEPLSPAVIDD